MAFMAKDKIVRTGDDLNLATLVGLQTNATALNGLAADEAALNALADDATVLGGVADAAAGATMTANNRIVKVAKVPLVAATGTTAGGVLNWLNPEATAIIVTRFVVDITGVKAGETVDFGVSAATPASSDTLIDGLSTATAGVFDNIENAGTNGKAIGKVAAAARITGTASATLAGGDPFAGFAYIHYVLA